MVFEPGPFDFLLAHAGVHGRTVTPEGGGEIDRLQRLGATRE